MGFLKMVLLMDLIICFGCILLRLLLCLLDG